MGLHGNIEAVHSFWLKVCVETFLYVQPIEPLHLYLARMAVRIETSVLIHAGEVKPWEVHTKFLKEVQGQQFINLPGSNCPQLLRLILNKSSKDIPSGMSLAQLKGLQLLKDRRNAAQQAAFQNASTTAAAALFEAPAASKKKRCNQQDQAVLRESPEIMTVVLEELGDAKLLMIRPAHPTDDVWVELTAPCITTVLEFVRMFLDPVAEACPRGYSKHQDGDTKVYKMGHGREAVHEKGTPLKYRSIRKENPTSDEANTAEHSAAEPNGAASCDEADDAVELADTADEPDTAEPGVAAGIFG